MNAHKTSQLRFNFGFLLESPPGTIRDIDLDYPSVRLGGGVQLAPLQGSFQVTRTTQGLYLKGALHSQAPAECARCLETFVQPVVAVLDDLFYYPPANAPEGEYTVAADGILDLGPLVRELTLLDAPLQALCRLDCKGLCQECGANLNEGECGCQDEELDPRLARLRYLLDQETGLF